MKTIIINETKLHDDDIQNWMKPYIEATTDEELYKLEIEDYEEDDIDKNGNILSTYNPKSKWDYYGIGGRWDNGDNVIQIKDFKLYDDLDDNTIALYKRAWDSFEGKSELSEEDNSAIFGGFRMWNDTYYLERYGTKAGESRRILHRLLRHLHGGDLERRGQPRLSPRPKGTEKARHHLRRQARGSASKVGLRQIRSFRRYGFGKHTQYARDPRRRSR